MSVTIQSWPVCVRCQTPCVQYLAPMGGWAWKQDCRCRKPFYVLEGMSDGKPFQVYPATGGWGAVAILSLALVLVTAVAVILILKYQGLEAQVWDACSETGAAAKLDLSSFVPLCLRVK